VSWCPKYDVPPTFLQAYKGQKKEANHKDNTQEEGMQKEAIVKDNAKTSGLDRVKATQPEVGKINQIETASMCLLSKKPHPRCW